MRELGRRREAGGAPKPEELEFADRGCCSAVFVGDRTHFQRRSFDRLTFRQHLVVARSSPVVAAIKGNLRSQP